MTGFVASGAPGAAGPAAPEVPAAAEGRQRWRPWEHRPPGFGSVPGWFAAGLLRNGRGVAGGLAGGWFNLPYAVLLAAFETGWVALRSFGGITLRDLPVVGNLLPTPGFEVVSVLSAGWLVPYAALDGLVRGLLRRWQRPFSADPVLGLGVLVGQVATALLVGVAFVLLTVAFEGRLLRLRGARRPSAREAAFLLPILRDCAARLRLASLPALLVDDSREANATAGARHLVVNSGLLDEFGYDREVVAAVLSHELTHWRNADAVADRFVSGVALPLYLAYLLVSALRRAARGSFLGALVLLLGWPVVVTVRLVVVPLAAPAARDAEYRADQGAVAAGHRQGMRRVLTRLRQTVEGGRDSWERVLAARHPPSELRLERLQEPGRSYPLPELDAPGGPGSRTSVPSQLQRD